MFPLFDISSAPPIPFTSISDEKPNQIYDTFA